ncbi:hypothetical protein RQP46_002978 [Phenoliferia psychrophenolica]
MFTLKEAWISIRDWVIEAQPPKPEPAPPSPAVAPPTPGDATESSTPALPPELVADIIDLTVELLVSKERDLASQAPITNHFLLSAMLVDRTWRDIAVSALLKNGLVTPAKVDHFISQVKSHQLDSTLARVRFGPGSAGLDDARDSSGDDAQFDALIGSLPALKQLEFVGQGLIFRSSLPTGYCKLDRILLSNSSLLECRIFHKLVENPPPNLFIYETRQPPKIEAPSALDTDAASRFKFLLGVEKFVVSSNQLKSSIEHLSRIATIGNYNPLDIEDLPPLRLRTFHFNCTSHMIIPIVPELINVLKLEISDALQYPFLNHLAAHLEILHYFATTGARPRLASLHVLTYPECLDHKPKVTLEEAERMLLELVDLPVLAKLKVPACWRSDAVEGACKAKEVDLQWV